MRLIVRVGHRHMNSATMPSLVTQVPESVGRAPALPREPTRDRPTTGVDAAASYATDASLSLEPALGCCGNTAASGYAYATTLQPDLERFGDEHGFLAYKTVGKTALVLSDPIAPRETHAA